MDGDLCTVRQARGRCQGTILGRELACGLLIFDSEGGHLPPAKNSTTIGIIQWLPLNLKPLVVLSAMTADTPRMISVKPTTTLLMISPNSYFVLCILLNQYMIANTNKTQPAPMKNCMVVVLKTSDTASSLTRGLVTVEVTALSFARESACAS